MNEVVIVDVVRTASGRGKPGGAVNDLHPAALLTDTIKALVDRNGAKVSVRVRSVAHTAMQPGVAIPLRVESNTWADAWAGQLVRHHHR